MIEHLLRHLDRGDPGGVRGLYVFGSSVVGGLRPDSDLDLLLVTDRSLDADERTALLHLLFRFSGRRASVTPGRPVELTSVVLDEVVPWAYPPMCDFLYGEWLRTELADGRLPERHRNPDLAVLLTTLREHARTLRGPDPAGLLSPVPGADLRRAILDSLGPLLDDLSGDERNVLLTLARMVVTLETGEILPKDQAARRLLPGLPAPDRSVLALAAAGYLGEAVDDWAGDPGRAHATATDLAARIRSAGDGPGAAGGPVMPGVTSPGTPAAPRGTPPHSRGAASGRPPRG